MQELDLFDCNCMLGRAVCDKGWTFDTAEDLLKSMKYHFINKALVYSSAAKFNAPVTGNEELGAMVNGHDNLYKSWVVLPDYVKEFYSAEDLHKKLAENKVSSVRLCPRKHSFELSGWCCGRLYEIFDKMHIPVFIDLDLAHWSDPAPWDKIHDICIKYPGMPVILTRIGCGYNRNLFALLKKCPNLYFEISYFAANRGLEEVCEEFGAERMLFGTDSPIHAPSSPIGLLYYSSIPFSDKQKIASGNLEYLLGRVNYGI